jgi:hypothetical protein
MSQRNPFRQQIAANERTQKWLEQEEEKLKTVPVMIAAMAIVDMRLMKLKTLRAALNVVTYFCWELGGVTVTKGGEDD